MSAVMRQDALLQYSKFYFRGKTIMTYSITVPVENDNKECLLALRSGDTVLLSGEIYTARDQAHKRMADCLETGEQLSFALEGSAIYYVGPTPEREGQVIGSAGPTTSGRMDPYSPTLLDLGNKIMIGKGRRNNAVKKSLIQNGAVYLGAVGGAGALMAECIKKTEILAWEDLGCEAVRKLTVENMPLTVIIDSQGNDLYDSGPEEYLKSISENNE